MAAKQQETEKLGLFARIAKFFGEVREEGKKVTWPGKDKAYADTALVLLTSAVVAVLIGTEDFVLSQAFQWLLMGGS